MPLVSIVMAVRDGMPFLPEAVESVLAQSFEDFELIAIDDGSKDKSLQFLHGVKDRRVKLVVNRTSLGLSKSLNKGLMIAKGKYVARMDHDDISLRERIANQVEYLEKDLQIDVLGTWAKTLGLQKEQVWQYPTDDEKIRAELVFNSNLVHSSVMLRAASLKRAKLLYDPKVARAQDYDLWGRAAGKLRFGNLGQVLLRYRVHPRQVGRKFGAEQQAVASAVRLRFLKQLGLRPTQEQLQLHNAISVWNFPKTKTGLAELETWLLVLQTTNKHKGIFPKEAFQAGLQNRWWAACRNSISLGKDATAIYRGSSLAGGRGIQELALFYAKAAVKEFSR